MLTNKIFKQSSNLQTGRPNGSVLPVWVVVRELLELLRRETARAGVVAEVNANEAQVVGLGVGKSRLEYTYNILFNQR